MFSMILRRMEWMEEKGIRQWNVAEYDEIYPLSYYEEERQKGELFVLADRDTNEIVCGAVLKEEDERWEDRAPSIYVHNFVSKTAPRHVGRIFLIFAEKYAAERGKRYLRLDSARDNQALASYYEKIGFAPAGSCVEGGYHGILRQKEL